MNKAIRTAYNSSLFVLSSDCGVARTFDECCNVARKDGHKQLAVCERDGHTIQIVSL